MERRLMMSKFMIGVATAALWFVLSHAANAERICRQVCDDGTCVSRCAVHPDVVVRENDHYYRDDEDRGPGVDVHVPGVAVDIGR
jgi:hypothetical protein